MPDDNDSDRGKKLRQNEQLLEASSIGLMFPIAMALGYAWGWGMDKFFHTSPWRGSASSPHSSTFSGSAYGKNDER